MVPVGIILVSGATMSIINLPIGRLSSLMRMPLARMARNLPGFVFLRRVWALSAPFWLSPQDASSRRLLALFVAIKLAMIYVAVRQNE